MVDSQRFKNQSLIRKQTVKILNKMTSQMNPLNLGFLKVKSRGDNYSLITNGGRIKNDYPITSKRYKVRELYLSNNYHYFLIKKKTAQTENHWLHPITNRRMNMLAITQHFITQNINRLIEVFYPEIN